MKASTPAVAAAVRAGIAHRVLEYRHDPDAEAVGVHAATALGLPVERVFKTLVADTGERLLVAIVPVAARLDLKALAVLAEVKRVEMADPKAAERATGYVVGGISPLGQQRRLATFLDASALAFPTIFVSAGKRGLELELSPADLLALTGGSAGPIASGG